MFRPFRFFSLVFIFPFFLWAQEEVLIPVPLYVENVYSGEIPLRINGKVLLQPHPLLEELRPYLKEDSLEIALNRWSPDEWIPYESLAGSLIRADFDDALLIFSVTIPPESRRPETLSLMALAKPPPDNLVEPARLSGVLNMEGRARVDYEDPDFSVQLEPELIVNYSGYVMETRSGIQNDGNILYFDYLRFVKEFPGMMFRAEGGDFTYNADGFLPRDMVGLALSRKTSLNQSYQSRPEYGQTIFFPEPTDVEIRINDRIVRKQSVPAGTWTFKNFPLTQGANEVVILWTDSQGVEHRESFFRVYDSGLLNKNELDWGGAFGTDSWITFNPALLFHLNSGLTDTLTAGMSTYYDLNGGFFSLETPLLYAASFGSFSLVPAAEWEIGEGYGVGATLNHSYSETRKERFKHNFGSSWGYSLESESALSQTLSVRAYYVYLPQSGLSITPSVSWSYETVESQNALDLSVKLRSTSGDGNTISIDLGVAFDDDVWSPSAAITYSASFPDIQQNLYARGDLSGEKMTLSWNRYKKSDEKSGYTLGATSIIPANNEDRFTMTLNGGYLHPMFNLSLSQGFSAFFSSELYNNTTTFSAESALVYADGVLGLSQPISGSFAIIDSEIGPMSINPSSYSSLLEVKEDRPGILPSVSPYRYTTLRMMPENLPVGSDINDYTLSVFPTYRSGTLIRAEEKIYMYAGGILTDRENRPLPFLLGEIIPVPGLEETYEKGEWPREFFTDEEGYFECYSLSPGEYLLTQKDKELTFIVDVTANESGYCDLGVVKPEN